MTSTHPGDFQRRILLMVTGLTPQVLTETVFALHRDRPDELPTEIHLISTREGLERAHKHLLAGGVGWFYRLCGDYHLPAMEFGKASLHEISDVTGKALEDIRELVDAERAADCITEWVRRFTYDDEAQLHVSLAGGRKTMGYYAGQALSLLGRPQDRLSHVLVSAPFETHPQFFYPTPYSNIIHANDPAKTPLNTCDAEVVLADIPFLRLRRELPEALTGGGGLSFSGLIRRAQEALEKKILEIDLPNARILAGGHPVKLQPGELAFYVWLACRCRDSLPPLLRPKTDAPNEEYALDYLSHYHAVVGEDADGDDTGKTLKKGMKVSYFDGQISSVNAQLKDQLIYGSGPYEIQRFGKRGETRYGLNLPPEAIRMIHRKTNPSIEQELYLKFIGGSPKSN